MAFPAYKPYTDLPKAECWVAWHPTRPNGHWEIIAECPFCKGAHNHAGGCGLQPMLGVRASDCSMNGEYELVMMAPRGDHLYEGQRVQYGSVFNPRLFPTRYRRHVIGGPCRVDRNGNLIE